MNIYIFFFIAKYSRRDEKAPICNAHLHIWVESCGSLLPEIIASVEEHLVGPRSKGFLGKELPCTAITVCFPICKI